MWIRWAATSSTRWGGSPNRRIPSTSTACASPCSASSASASAALRSSASPRRLSVDNRQLAARIDLAFLKIDSGVTIDKLREAVQQVEQLGLRSLCVSPVLAGTVKKNFPQIKVSAVVAYPL